MYITLKKVLLYLINTYTLIFTFFMFLLIFIELSWLYVYNLMKENKL